MSKPSYDNLYSRSAEQTLVAAALLRGAQVFEDRTVQRLLPRHFKDAQCRAAWEEITKHRDSNDIFDEVVIGSVLGASGNLDTAEWFNTLTGFQGNVYRATRYAEIVWNFARRRGAYVAIDRLGAAIFNGNFEETLETTINNLTLIKEAAK